MNRALEIKLDNIRIGSYSSSQYTCQDGYSINTRPVLGFDNSEVLAKLNAYQPLISADGNYHNEILKTVFNIGLKNAEARALWIIPNSIRHRRIVVRKKSGTEMRGILDCTLHRQFAQLVDKGIKHKVEFANKYGLLSRHELHNVVFRDSDSGQQFQMGESLLWWEEEILHLSACVKLWDMICSKNKQLKHVVLWHRDGIFIRLDGLEKQLVNRANMNLLTKWTKGDTRGPAMYYLSLELGRKLKDSLTLRLSDSPEREISVHPNTLLSNIWFMFFLEVSGKTRLIRCSACGEYFNTYDPRSQFCSTRCRMRKYRKRDHKIKLERGWQGRLL
jgi:hypothetical protein